MPGRHAILSPSSAARWLNCKPSARLEALAEDRPTEYSREGTVAHSVGEFLLGYHLVTKASAVYDITDEWDQSGWMCRSIEEMPEVIQGLTAHAKEADALGADFRQMLGFVHEGYVQPVYEAYLKALKEDSYARLFIETELDLTEWIPDGFGTCDAAVIAGNTLEIFDLKYGKGVRVDAVGNPQMRIYALGALRAFGELFDISTVRMTIIQPRLDSISSDEMRESDLQEWGEKVLKPAALTAYRGEGEQMTGDWCRFCKVRGRCRAAKEAVMETVRKCGDPRLMSPEEIAEALAELPTVKSWLTDVEEYTLEQALAGTRYPGFKLVEGRSVRKYSDPGKCAELLHEAGFTDEAIYKPRELRGISDMEKALRKKAFQELLGAYVIKPPGKPALVPDSDPRAEYSTAQIDFNDIYQNI